MASNNVWMSVSDLMTGLMVIFLFIAIAYMIRVRDDISEYKDTKEQIYNRLNDKFSNNEIAQKSFPLIQICLLGFLRPQHNFPLVKVLFQRLLK